ncbi:MAG: cytotoxic translational repressor of toxin-antitoxin stability system [Cellulomonas sp.]|jgi:hypothetical protein|nr:cytotoxic translational repressor of toxin-antitoxin stability system [Cellulomonas sp.]
MTAPGWPPVTRTAHDAFCRTEGWHLVVDARGRPVSHHVTYELSHPDGRTLRTRISRPVRPEPYGARMTSVILRDQLEVDQGQFWACVDDGVKPLRRAEPSSPAETLPVGLLRVLRDQLHLSESQLRTITRDEAIAAVNEHWSRPPE